MENEIITGLDPIYNNNCKVLLLGSFPSVASRKANMYYSHPQNRFWKTLSNILNHPFPKTNEDKKEMLLMHNIALWDVVHSCSIKNSQDASIKDVCPNKIEIILKVNPNIKIFTLGKTATKLLLTHTNFKSTYLPSTSPANCAVNEQELNNAFSVILNYIK